LSCSRWPTVTWKVFTARPSSVVRHLACEMFTPCSVNDFEMAASRPGRSSHVTCTATGRTVLDSSSQATSRRRAGSRSSAFGQSRVWMTTPCPRLMKPMISSPGTGVQHFANFTRMSASPWTRTPAIDRFATGRRAAGGASGTGAAGASEPALDTSISTASAAWARFTLP